MARHISRRGDCGGSSENHRPANLQSLSAAHQKDVCGGIPIPPIPRLLGGLPSEVPQRNHDGSPSELLPLGVPQILITGALDRLVPPALGKEYEVLARKSGDKVEMIVIEGAGHFEVIAPGSAAWPIVQAAVLSLCEVREAVLRMRATSSAKELSLLSYTGTSAPASRAAPPLALSVAICTCLTSGNMSGNSRAFNSTAGSIFRASACAGRFLQDGGEVVQDADERGYRGLIHRGLHLVRLGKLAAYRFFARVIADEHHTVRICSDLVAREDAREFVVRFQIALLEQRPHLTGKFGREQLRCKTAERGSDVVYVSFEHRERTVVARRVDGLRQIDDHRAIGGNEHVEFREIAMDEPDAQHAHDLSYERKRWYSRAVSGESSTSLRPGAGCPDACVTSSMISTSLRVATRASPATAKTIARSRHFNAAHARFDVKLGVLP